MRLFVFGLFLLNLLLGIQDAYAGTEFTMSEMEWDSDHYGSDLDNKGLDLITSDPTLCEDACAKNPKCMAWTYIKPNTVQGPRARCWLKHSIPPRQPNPNTVTGYKILKKG